MANKQDGSLQHRHNVRFHVCIVKIAIGNHAATLLASDLVGTGIADLAALAQTSRRNAVERTRGVGSVGF